MALTSTNVVVFILMIASMFSVSMTHRGWHWNLYRNPRKFIVGGNSNWTFGFDYITWAVQNSPFYVNDTLVFRYDPPSETNTHPHNVYLLSNYSSFQTCELSKAEMLANFSDGGGEGFEFVLSKSQPYYLACAAGNGFHCINGTMKFAVWPLDWH